MFKMNRPTGGLLDVCVSFAFLRPLTHAGEFGEANSLCVEHTESDLPEGCRGTFREVLDKPRQLSGSLPVYVPSKYCSSFLSR